MRVTLLLVSALTLTVTTTAAAQTTPVYQPYAPVAPPPAACPAGSQLSMGAAGQGCYAVVRDSRPHPGLFWPGFSAFVASYAFSVAFGAWTFENETGGHAANIFGASLIPVAGPFVAAGFEDHEEDAIAFAVLGGIQAVGMTLMILSHAFPQERETVGPRVAFTGNGVFGLF